MVHPITPCVPVLTLGVSPAVLQGLALDHCLLQSLSLRGGELPGRGTFKGAGTESVLAFC